MHTRCLLQLARTRLLYSFNELEWCNPWPHVAYRHISISQLLSSWRQSHCDVIRYWAGNVHRYVRTYVCTYGHLTAFNI